ncbi:MAG: hypothetical protein IPN29_09980 [Saprospiraceae bacterium]|nr:hypothetical protein [Saprospiraceae bacterium]
MRGEYAMKIVGNKVTYNTYYLKNARSKVNELQSVFYELNVKVCRGIHYQGVQETRLVFFKSNDKFKANVEEKVSFYVVGSKLQEESEKVAQIKFTILKDDL